MNAGQLATWLLEEGIGSELGLLNKLVAIQEFANITETANLSAKAKDIDWNRLLLAGSVLARSTERAPQEAALLIATAAMTLNVPARIRDGAAVLFEHMTNRLAVSLAERRHELATGLEARLGTAARLDGARLKLQNSVLVGSTGVWLEVNAFQRAFWAGASDGSGWLSVSAPTASGKTFLVLQWLVDQMRSKKAGTAIYLAPTRALVSEIEDSLKQMLDAAGGDTIDVTSLPLRQHHEARVLRTHQVIAVFTQERLHLLANVMRDALHVDLLIVDEAHKIGDRQRGVILQDAIERISRTNPDMRVLFISPATQNPGSLLEDVPVDSIRRSIANDTPTVLQNVIYARQVPHETKQYQLSLRTGITVEPIGILNLANRPGGIRKRIAFIAEAITGDRSGTLIYANGADEAEKIAFLLNQDARIDRVDPELQALADLSRKGVHNSYLLASLVERGVAFHYGNMPSLLRAEIERLFRAGKIRFLVCTSTLIEGVNLSCRNIVLRGPRKGNNTPMEAHDFWNLAGRAGRWGNEFQGSIICVDPQDSSAWPDGVPSRARYPIRRETDEVLGSGEAILNFLRTRRSATPAELERAGRLEQVGAYLLATHLREGTIRGAPFSKRHDAKILMQIDQALVRLADGMTITSEIAGRHPGVSAAGMQALLEHFRGYKGPIELLLPARAEDDEAVNSLISIMTLINRHLFPAFVPETLVPLHAITVHDWLCGWSLARMIRSRIAYNQRHRRKVDIAKICRQTMEMVEQTARFLAPKFLSAYLDVLKLFLVEVGREELISDDLDIGVALEFGISTPTLLSLMESGLSRMSAVALYEIMAIDDLDQEGCRAWVRENNTALSGMGLPTIILREVKEKLLGEHLRDADDG